MTLTKRQRKRAATAGAVVMMLGVLHLSTKDASGTPAQCEISGACSHLNAPGVQCETGHSDPPIVGPCDPTTTPPSTVVFEVTPYKPGDVTLAPPVQSAPATTTVTLAPPVSIVGPVDVLTLAVDTTPTTIVIEEDDPRWDCHTMGNHRCGPPVSSSGKLALPATS